MSVRPSFEDLHSVFVSFFLFQAPHDHPHPVVVAVVFNFSFVVVIADVVDVVDVFFSFSLLVFTFLSSPSAETFVGVMMTLKRQKMAGGGRE